MQTKLFDETGEYNESDEEAKHPGAFLGLIMGIYPAVLIVGILLLFSGIAIRSAFKSIFPNSVPHQTEIKTPADVVNNEPKLEDVSSK